MLDAVGVADGDTPFAPVFKIDDVLVRGSDWTDGFLDALDRNELGHDTLDHLGYSLCGAADAHASVPWTNVDTIVARFTEDVDVRADDMRLFGVAISAYTKEFGIGLEDFEYDPAGHVASWTFNQALPKDRLLLTLDGQLASKSSGAGGGNFELRFDVLPGDQDSDGLVHISEAIVYRDRLLGRVKSDDFPVRMDLNGDGFINAADVLVYRDIVLDTLPKGGPGIETVSGTAGDDRLEITAVDDDSIAYSLNGGPVVTVDGIYGLEFNALGGDDRMVLDVSSSTTLPSGGIDYDGGDNTPGGEDVLEVQGGVFDSVANTIGGPDAGSLVLGVGGLSSEIRYVGSESTDIGSSATVVRFDLPGIADPNVVLEDWGAGQGRLSRQTIFDYPADGGELIINLGDDDQALIVDSLDLNANTRLTLDGQGGDDAVVFDAPGLTITRDLWVTAETVVQTEEVAVAGLTVLSAGTTGMIALSDSQNDFVGDVRIADAGNAVLRDKNALAVPLALVSNDLTLTADTGDLALGTVTASSGTATLTAAAGSITESNGTLVNVAAVDAEMTAGGAIGTSDEPIGVTISGTLTAAAPGGIYLEDTGGLTLTDIETAGGNVWIRSSGGIVAGNVVANSDVTLIADTGDLALGVVTASGGTATLTATVGSIVDDNGAMLNVTADALAMRAGVKIGDADLGSGSPTQNENAIDTQVATLAAVSADGIYVLETDGVTIDATGADPSLSDLRTTSDGPIKVVTLTGDLTVVEGATNLADLPGGVVAGGTGDVLLEARGGNVVLDASLSSDSGHISVMANGDVVQNADIVTGGGTVLVEAGNEIDMQSGSTTSGGGNIRVEAGDNVDLGEINAGTGDASLVAGGSIVDNNGAALNIAADALAMWAGGKIGDADAGSAATDNLNAIDTSVNVLAAEAGECIYVLETAGVTIDDTEEITVQQVNFNSTTSPVTDRRSDLRTTPAGPIKVVTLAGDLTVNEGSTNPNDVAGGVAAGGDGDVLLDARGGDVGLGASVSGGTGHITVSASGAVTQDADASTIGGTVFVAAGDSIVMTPGTSTTSGGGNIHLEAANDLAVGEINVGMGDVSLVAGGNIVDSNGAASNVLADALAMNAGGKIGDADAGSAASGNLNAIDTSVNVLAAEAASGIYVLESDGLAVDGIDPIDVTRVNFNSTTAAVAGIPLSDLRTTDGPIKVVVLTGDLKVNEGATNPADLPGGVVAGGSGDVLLDARGGDVILNAAVGSGSGHITVSANGAVTQDAAVTSGGGDIYFTAGGDILVGEINAGLGDVALDTGGSILDGNAAGLNITADALAMNAGGTIGDAEAGNGTPTQNVNAIDTSVNVLAAEAASGIYVLESDGLAVDGIDPIDVTRVNFNSTTAAAAGIPLSDLRTTAGPIKVVVLSGDLTVNEGVANPADLPGGVVAGGSGDVLLDARGGDVILNAAVTSGSGHITVSANGAVTQDAAVTSGGGDIYFTAGGDILVGEINAGSGDVALDAGGSILDGNAAGLNITADALAMNAGGKIGDADAGNGSVDTEPERD